MSNKTIKIDSAVSRIILAVIILICIIGVFFAVKWMFAQSIASSAQELEMAEIAAGMDSSNPQTHYSIAVLLENSFVPENLPKSMAEFEKATSLSPNDYRLWLALGKARERSGNFKGAELAFQRALELAPNYSQVQWTYGNSLLRQGKNKEAFVQIGKAVENDPTLANPAVNTAWMVFDGDLNKIREVVGDSNHTRAALASFYVNQKNFDEAISVWNSIPAKQRKEIFKEEGTILFNTLISAQKYSSALQIKNELNISDNKNTVIGKISNGGFEENIKEEKAGVFEWEITEGNQPQIGVDNQQKHGGARSLVLGFSGADHRAFRSISQTLAVNGGKQYNLKFFYKADLDLAPTFKWEVADTVEGKILASTEALSKKTDWTPVNLNFTPAENSEGVIIRLVRTDCSSVLCSTSGKIWFDDFSLN